MKKMHFLFIYFFFFWGGGGGWGRVYSSGVGPIDKGGKFQSEKRAINVWRWMVLLILNALEIFLK